MESRPVDAAPRSVAAALILVLAGARAWALEPSGDAAFAAPLNKEVAATTPAQLAGNAGGPAKSAGIKKIFLSRIGNAKILALQDSGADKGAGLRTVRYTVQFEGYSKEAGEERKIEGVFVAAAPFGTPEEAQELLDRLNALNGPVLPANAAKPTFDFGPEGSVTTSAEMRYVETNGELRLLTGNEADRDRLCLMKDLRIGYTKTLQEGVQVSGEKSYSFESRQ